MQRSAVAVLAQEGGGGGGFKVNYSPDWSLFTTYPPGLLAGH